MEQQHEPSASTSKPQSLPRGADRCRRRSRANGRCRLPVQDPATGLCFRHATRGTRNTDNAHESADVSADLFGEVVPSFRSAEEINATLANLVILVAQGRISPRRAAVITYALSLILRGVLVIDKKASDQPFQIDWSKESWRPACAVRAAAAAEVARNSPKDQPAAGPQDNNRADARASARTHSGKHNGENYDAAKSYADLRA
ncbi:MAG: hypothetical protein WA817_07960 [Candidatus Acidiferrum sp.]